MISLLQLITSKIKSVHSKVYLEKAPSGTSYPYVVYKFPTSNEDECREDFILEVDILDNKADTTQLETITNNIDQILNRLKYIDSNMQVSIYRINRLMIPDPDETIHRRQLRYQVKTYFNN